MAKDRTFYWTLEYGYDDYCGSTDIVGIYNNQSDLDKAVQELKELIEARMKKHLEFTIECYRGKEDEHEIFDESVQKLTKLKMGIVWEYKPLNTKYIQKWKSDIDRYTQIKVTRREANKMMDFVLRDNYLID